MKNLDSLKQNPKELFDFLYDELDNDDVLSQEVKSFFELNDIFELAKSAIDNNCSILTVQNVINKIGIIKVFELIVSNLVRNFDSEKSHISIMLR